MDWRLGQAEKDDGRDESPSSTALGKVIICHGYIPSWHLGFKPVLVLFAAPGEPSFPQCLQAELDITTRLLQPFIDYQ